MTHPFTSPPGEQKYRDKSLETQSGARWEALRLNLLQKHLRHAGEGSPCTLLYEPQRRDAMRGLAAVCFGGGMGTASCVERSFRYGTVTINIPNKEETCLGSQW